jgi:polar amino acid transport system substrate-binding protein
MNTEAFSLETLQNCLSQTDKDGYFYIALGIVVILFIAHLYSTAKEKKRLNAKINSYVQVFQKAFDLSEDAILVLSKGYTVNYINPCAISLLGLQDDMVDKVLEPMPKIRKKREWELLSSLIDNEKKNNSNSAHTYVKSFLKVKDDEELPINLLIDTVNMPENKDEYTIVSIHNLTKENAYIDSMHQHSVTKLPNHLKILQDLPPLYSKVHLENKKIALVLLDLDNFTRLRSIVGYEQANQVLEKFSTYLKNIVSHLNISVYHTYDNHFLLMVSKVESLEEIQKFIQEIQSKLVSFYKIDDSNLHLTVSAGVALYPDSGSTRQLLDNAYKALHKAEQKGEGRVEVYLPEKQDKYDKLILYNDMKSGLKNGEFEVYYQPIVRADTHEIVSAEALIRWIHPTYGFISPEIFIGLMEKTGFIIELGKYILDEVLKQQKRWELFKFKQIAVSINVSMVEIATGEFVQHVEKQLAYHHVNPNLIKFEITEGVAMEDEGGTEKYFKALKKLGVSILLDDFGTGYTSFNYLKKFPADIIKIDKSLVDYILENKEDQRIVKAMIDLGHNLGMKIVVEGVENKLMATMLHEFGCDFLQGYYFAKPLQVFELQKLLRA